MENNCLFMWRFNRLEWMSVVHRVECLWALKFIKPWPQLHWPLWVWIIAWSAQLEMKDLQNVFWNIQNCTTRKWPHTETRQNDLSLVKHHHTDAATKCVTKTQFKTLKLKPCNAKHTVQDPCFYVCNVSVLLQTSVRSGHSLMRVTLLNPSRCC